MGERGLGHLWRPTYIDRHGVKRTSSIYWLKIRGYRVSTETSDLKAAKRFQIEKAAELGKGNVAALAGTRVTFDALKQRILDDYAQNRRKSARHLETCFAHLRRHLGHLRAAKIDEDVLARYVATRLDEAAAPASINLELSALQRAMRLLARKLPRIPKFTFLEVRNARKGFFERADFESVLSFMPDHLKAPLEVAYITGWRFRSEVLTRQWQHVDFGAGWLRLEPGETKNADGRMFPLTPALRTVLEAQRAHTDEVERRLGCVIPWVFHHRGGQRIVSVQKSWHTARVRAGQPNRLIHDLRRTAVRNLERAGVPRSAAMRLVGHRTQAMYLRYAIADERLLAESGEKLEALHEAQRGQASKVTAMPEKKG